MKAQLITALVLMNAATALAAGKIECLSPRQEKLTITADQKQVGWFRVDVDKSLSSYYLGAVENRVLVQTKSGTADIIDDWDGNSGVKVSMRKGFLSAPVGTTSKAFVTVMYDDIAQDRVSHQLSCKVVE